MWTNIGIQWMLTADLEHFTSDFGIRVRRVISRPVRAELTGDIHEQFMWERCREYQRVKWYEDVWEAELTIYRDKRRPTPRMVRATLKDVKITKENAYIMAPILARIGEDERYDFKRFMHENWDKRQADEGGL